MRPFIKQFKEMNSEMQNTCITDLHVNVNNDKMHNSSWRNKQRDSLCDRQDIAPLPILQQELEENNFWNSTPTF